MLNLVFGVLLIVVNWVICEIIKIKKKNSTDGLKNKSNFLATLSQKKKKQKNDEYFKIQHASIKWPWKRVH